VLQKGPAVRGRTSRASPSCAFRLHVHREQPQELRGLVVEGSGSGSACERVVAYKARSNWRTYTVAAGSEQQQTQREALAQAAHYNLTKYD
jgi:transposase-like protein